MKFSEFLNESLAAKLNEDKVEYESLHDLESDLNSATSKANIKKLIAAFEENYLEDGEEDDVDEESFVRDLTRSFRNIGAYDLADSVSDIRDIENLEHYLGDGSKIDVIADKLHYDQRNELAQVLLKFILNK